ncbi:putative membrane protein [Sphingomonas sp. S17]|jgi:hypothetical protein|uniref:DUF3429 domain-containing protein n=3 Tax=Pseudomonadota TaxID=1224 RepID=A0A411LJX8_SPHPI|nr:MULTISPECIES: DUF3429 domain-containing protein [Sphingomonas]EGI54153.1 putative membrane protein [Sphingomonas sp. S17]MBQ1480338.1 DUF3429 domain-containing protein [Sphingomonas sp.]MCM3678728.1 DUF3429 domain-containing protein [Sphingomonas paucimobilis]MDG5969756.1 hypothetical protein [Sphingomonas paucimobilis]NNG58613.1 DUF3429 domain-containing protein [Sphingomonas paucimobilis]
MSRQPLPTPVRLLGPAGILPQAICVAMAVFLPEHRILAGIAGGLYAALILSFLGGLWWMEALVRGDRRATPYVVAVLPSLIGWAAWLAPLVGLMGMAGALMVLGIVILISPVADKAIGRLASEMPGWWRLRWVLSIGLGGLTLLLGIMMA